jgi:peptidoglycan glycosyltransferase
LSAEVAAELRELMVGVVARGTAKSAFRDPRGRPLLGPVRVSGKTGSLSGLDPKGRYEWFIGVAPAEKPTIAIATVVVNGPVWWRNASQISALVLQRVFCPDSRCDPEAANRLHAARQALTRPPVSSAF